MKKPSRRFPTRPEERDAADRQVAVMERVKRLRRAGRVLHRREETNEAGTIVAVWWEDNAGRALVTLFDERMVQPYYHPVG